MNNAAALQLATREPGDPSMGVACLEACLHHTDIPWQAKLSAVPRPVSPSSKRPLPTPRDPIGSSIDRAHGIVG